MFGIDDLALESGICLALIRGGTDHGYALATQFQPGHPVGDVYSLTRPAVYRCLTGLEDERLIVASPDKGARGQTKKRLRLTSRGADTARRWLDAPVEHLRDVRLDFLAKLLVREMLGLPLAPLIRSQRRMFADLFTGLSAESPRTPVALWRREQALAVARFLDELEGRDRQLPKDLDPASHLGPVVPGMILSARNQLTGTVHAVTHGGILSSVKIIIDPDQMLTSTITHEATEQLHLAPGSAVTAIFKATDVMVAAPTTKTGSSRTRKGSTRRQGPQPPR